MKCHLFLMVILVFTGITCKKDKVDFGTIKKPYALGLLNTKVISYSKTNAIVSVDFVLFDENGLLNMDDFKIKPPDFVSGNITINHTQREIIRLNASSLGCYKMAILNEFNPSYDAYHLESATRGIIRSIQDCGQYIYAYYPSRDNDLNVDGNIHLLDKVFTEDKLIYNQTISKIYFDSKKMFYTNNQSYNCLYWALDSLINLDIWNPNENNNIICIYENANEMQGSSLNNILKNADKKNIRIHAIKFVPMDSLQFTTTASKGVYFTDYYPYFMKTFESDANIAAKHFNTILSSNYAYYRITYDVEMKNRTFYIGFWYYSNMTINLPNGEQRILNVYFQF